jgi:hypothetical protein
MRKLHFFGLLLCVLTAASAFAIHGDMGVGTEPLTDGSQAYPWLIEDLADFDAFAGNSAYWAAGVHTKLMSDIDLAGYSNGSYQKIGIDYSTPFSGVFDGNNKTISGFSDQNASEDVVGLFGCVREGEIKNLIMINVLVEGRGYIGGLVGQLLESILINCHVEGTVEGRYRVGVVVGDSWGSSIHGCSARGEASASDFHAGGVVGFNEWGDISLCSFNGTVSGGTSVGGLIGSNEFAPISQCYSIATIIGDDSVGGLIGSNNSGNISNCYSATVVEGGTTGGLIGMNANSDVSNCYSTGEVYGIGNVGGLLGANLGGTNVFNCYSACVVNGTSHEIGGLVGENWGNWSNCFWDTETSGTSDGVGNENPDPAGVAGKTTAEMMVQSTFTGWDFTTPVWVMLRERGDYPRLAWQAVFAGDVAGLYGVDLVDFAYLARYWGLDCGVEDCGRADIDGSGDVGLADLVYVSEDWLKE